MGKGWTARDQAGFRRWREVLGNLSNFKLPFLSLKFYALESDSDVPRQRYGVIAGLYSTICKPSNEMLWIGYYLDKIENKFRKQN